ncbi:MAG: hypothetical protein FWD78_17560 [Treponema sp.]|nr:hypothetical protein [Treponema sp.]
MTPRERLIAVLNGKPCDDRLPMVEWAAWWDKTINRWKQEGLPAGLDLSGSLQYFGLDELRLHSAAPAVPKAAYHGAPVINNEADYQSIKNEIFSEQVIRTFIEKVRESKSLHEAGSICIRIWLDGFFWFPRRLFGIEPHMYAFYDSTELMHRMNDDLEKFNMSVLETLFSVLKPEFIGFAEDMSYNHGPMLSREMYNEFIMPHYQKLTSYIHANKVKTLVDSDGDITKMIPWLLEAGIEGVYPLERQAGVDINSIRKEYPQFIMLGGYDKMIMNKGEAVMRKEFERILPVMRSGYYIPSVDHQTPPGVSLDDYRIYIRLFAEYARKAVC